MISCFQHNCIATMQFTVFLCAEISSPWNISGLAITGCISIATPQHTERKGNKRIIGKAFTSLFNQKFPAHASRKLFYQGRVM